MRYLFLLLFAVVSIEIVLPQTNQLKFKHLTTTNGLSNNWIRKIYKDDVGFMWFGTADGLNRYDGHEFKVYRPKTIDGKSLGDISVSDILKKGTNELWICTDLGIYIYNYTDDELHQFPLLKSLVILCVVEDKENKIWFGTNDGLYRFDSKTKTLTQYIYSPANSSSISNSFVNTIFIDSDSKMWIGTQGGLNLYNKSSNSFVRYKPDDIKIGISTNDVYSICEDKNKCIWIGYVQDGLYVIRNYSENSIKLNKIIDAKIIKLFVDHNNILWIGRGSDEGLDRIKLDQFSINNRKGLEHFQNTSQDYTSLSDNSIFSIYEDNLNDIWIGTFGNGINYYSPRAKKFDIVSVNSNGKKSIYNNLINAIVEDEGNIYIGTEGGLDIFDKNSGTYSHYQNESGNLKSLSANPVYTICKDSRGNIWIGTWAGGLNLYNPQTKSFKRFLPGEKPGSISNANVFSIFEDSKENLWIGTIGGGLNRYNYKTGTFSTYKNDKNIKESLYSDMVNYIYQTSNGRLYISTFNSLEMYDYKNDNFIHFIHDSKDSTGNFGSILSIFEDSRKNIWIATNSGLEYFDEKSLKFTAYTTQQGLPDNTIQGILEDDKCNLWISTNKGISKFINGANRPNPSVFHNYTVDDWLSGNEFKKRAAFKNKQGIMYFGSSQGYTYFHPDSIKLNTIPPEIILSSFSIINSLPNDKNKELTKSINFIHELDLKYQNSDFVIKFAALNYLNPQNNYFKYKLEGYDSRWIEADVQQSATYTNLSPGEYTFKVIASNNDGVWNTIPKTLKIIIYPPWWKTSIFKAALSIFFISLFVGFSILRVRILKKQKRTLENTVQKRTRELLETNKLLEEKQEEITVQNDELSKHKDHLELLVKERTSDLLQAKEKAEESDRLKTAFLQNISHEIRTPLNAIIGFSDLLNDSFDNKEHLLDFSTIIKQSGYDLLEIINGILDIAKIESGLLPVNLERSNLNILFTEIETFFAEYKKKLNKEHIHLVLQKQCSNSNFEIILDQGKLKQILINLISNAFKFTMEGKIEVGCNLYDADNLNFYVSDTGIGIAKEKHEIIFERFRQIEEYDYHEGTGLGLSICKGLIQLLGGKIWLESELNVGTTFHFTIPYIKGGNEIVTIENQNTDLIDLNNKTIIIAEDDNGSYLYLRELFHGLNVTIVHAENGQVLMDKLENSLPDLILLDMKMPIKSGFDCLREMHAKNIKTKIIAQTAYAMSIEKERCYEAGCNGYISKPIKKDELFRVISEVLTNS